MSHPTTIEVRIVCQLPIGETTENAEKLICKHLSTALWPQIAVHSVEVVHSRETTNAPRRLTYTFAATEQAMNDDFMAPLVAQFYEGKTYISSVGWVESWTVVQPGHPCYGHDLLCRCESCSYWSRLSFDDKKRWVTTGARP